MLLVDVTTVLDKYNCTHWLSDGTLLGALRDNDFMKHDDDIDLGVWAADFDIRAVHELVTKLGCQILRLQGKPSDGMVITLGRAGIHLDMFFYYSRKNPNKNIYSSYYVLKKPYNTSNKATRYDFEYPTFRPLVRRKFLGHEFWFPKNATKYVETEYGSKWQKPKTNWDLVKDYYNMKLVGNVDDMAAERRMVEDYLKIRHA